MTTYIGIDLGTSNSAIAVFDGEQTQLITNAHGQISTPSIVRICDTGTYVGMKAKRFLHRDPANTHKEFKRLMGTETKTQPDSSGRQWSAEQLSAEVLKSLLNDALNQTGCKPDKAVITVPALFEIPQSKATANAGRMAGLSQVELLQEPVASALAAGWNADRDTGAWLVYDLGGGTFDVSLVEARDGLLRVIAHDGDNFLGGRDIDRALAGWVMDQIGEASANSDDSLASLPQEASNALFQQVEQAKIQLSNAHQTLIELELDIHGREVLHDLSINREQLNQIVNPIIDRTLAICARLLKNQGLSQNRLQKVVMVGGPAHMPVIQKRVAEELAPIAAADEDPMALVAKGAALYAATVGLGQDVQPDSEDNAASVEPNLWLQYPTVCSELTPPVMGRFIGGETISKVQLERADGGWQGPDLQVDEDQMFSGNLKIVAGKPNLFKILAFDPSGNIIATEPNSMRIVHGLKLSDPPLSRSIGVALANGTVKVFIERGTPLPAKRTFIQNTVVTLHPGDGGELQIPIVQGERQRARHCRKVGSLVIQSKSIDKPLNGGAAVEITIEVDKGGNMRASALLPDHGKAIPAIDELIMPSVELGALQQSATKIQQQITAMQQDAFRNRDENQIKLLDQLQQSLIESQTDLMQAGNNPDLCMRIQRNLIEIDAEIEDLQSQGELDDLLQECSDAMMSTEYWVSEYGNGAEKKMLDSLQTKMQVAFDRKRPTELQRLSEQFVNLRWSAYRRSPDFWPDRFEYYASHAHQARDLKKANKLVEKGRKLLDKPSALRPVVNELAQLLPHINNQLSENHGSGIH